jgi:hypothetical protein
MEQSKNTAGIREFVTNIKSNDTLNTLFLHYQSVIDNVDIASLNDSVWFFVLKTEIEKRSS